MVILVRPALVEGTHGFVACVDCRERWFHAARLFRPLTDGSWYMLDSPSDALWEWYDTAGQVWEWRCLVCAYAKERGSVAASWLSCSQPGFLGGVTFQ